MNRRALPLLCLILALLLAACGRERELDLAEVRREMLDVLASAGVTDTLPLETDALERMYGIDPSWVVRSAGFIAMYGAFPDEVILVEGVDAAARDRIAEKLEARLAEVLEQARDYDPESYAAARECRVRVDGRCVCLILSAHAAALDAVYAGWL